MKFEKELLENAKIQLIDGDRGINYPKLTDFKKQDYCLFLSAKNVTKVGFDFSETTFIDKEKDNILRAGKLERGDIVVTTRGTIGNIAFYSNEVPFENIRINSGMMIFRANKNKWNQRLLYFLLTSEHIKQQIISLTSGSAVPQLPARDLKKFQLPKISRDVQDLIDQIIGSISNKIELNKKTNQTLEEMAQAIFKEWFVDFRFPGYEKVKFIDGLPEGWKVGKLSDIADVIGGGTPSKKEDKYFRKQGEGIPWLTPKDLSGYNNKFIERGNLDISESGLKNSSVKVLPAGTILFSSRAPIGYMCIALNDITTNQGFKSLVPKDVSWVDFIYYYLKANILFIEGCSSGSTFKEVSGSIMKEIPVVVPNQDIVMEFDNLMYSLNNKKKEVRNEMISLKNTRDILLPKLMSGEIDFLTSEVV